VRAILIVVMLLNLGRNQGHVRQPLLPSLPPSLLRQLVPHGLADGGGDFVLREGREGGREGGRVKEKGGRGGEIRYRCRGREGGIDGRGEGQIGGRETRKWEEKAGGREEGREGGKEGGREGGTNLYLLAAGEPEKVHVDGRAGDLIWEGGTMREDVREGGREGGRPGRSA
jgi:hypothetical protein